MEQALVAALQWDPHIRGALIVLTAVLILPGSVYLLLATNMGARVGLLLAVTGLTGWLFLMGVIWTVYGIGLKGRSPEWVTKEIVTGDVSQSTLEVMREFPTKWKRITAGNKVYADAVAAADQVLAPSEAPPSAHGAPAEPEEPEFESPFDAPTDYVAKGEGFEIGGDNELFTIGRHKFYFRHSPHWAVIQVQPSLPQEGEVIRPEPDPSKPTTTVIMVRDLGSVRLPPFILAVSTGLMFGICCYVLHQRDKEIMRARTAAAGAQ
ncbi:MAG TPA: hypothetical protein VHF47_10985 [Acidimicrobiales bacterium]|nr:hypothetical protein [Acidimicrobiales bacterium]